MNKVFSKIYLAVLLIGLIAVAVFYVMGNKAGATVAATYWLSGLVSVGVLHGLVFLGTRIGRKGQN